MSPPRDIKTAKVFDVIFHPDTYRMGESNKNFMDLLRDTALDAIKSNWNGSKYFNSHACAEDIAYAGGWSL